MGLKNLDGGAEGENGTQNNEVQVQKPTVEEAEERDAATALPKKKLSAWGKLKTQKSIDALTATNEEGSEDGAKEKKTSRTSSWGNLQKKIAPTAKLSAGKMKREEQGEEWVIEQKLKANFYLDDGVSKWCRIYPIANGVRQSPIDIQPGKAKSDGKLKPLMVNYDVNCCKSVVNTGNSWKVDVDDKIATLTGGALSNEYKLIQYHAHWGTTAGAKGSEHTINGRLYDAELHLVHWNTKYGLFSKAVSEPDGLAVVGIFLEVGEKDHPEMEKLTKHLKDIKYKNMRTSIEEEQIDPAKFLPDDMTYWHYPGSLTTPPLDESVMWHVLRTPIQISKKQLDAMAAMRAGTKTCEDITCIINNFRPPMPINERNVKLFNGEVTKQTAQELQRLSSRTDTSEAAVAGNELATLKEDVTELKSMMGELQQGLNALLKKQSS